MSKLKVKKPNGFWNKERCEEEALKYTSKVEFREGSVSAYCVSKRNKWLNDITNHYETRGSKYLRFIYAYEFADNHVYIGLSFNIKKRHNEHLKRGSVFNHAEKTGLEPELKQLIMIPVITKVAVELEEWYLTDYTSKGWKPLNKIKTGGLGGNNLKWTLETCKTEALKYTSRSSFENGSSSAYLMSLRNKWIDDICVHMDKLKEVAGHWNFENCKAEAFKYKNRTDFNRLSPGASKSASKNGWLTEICSHMVVIKKKNGFHTLEKCIELAKRCKTKKEYKALDSTAYKVVYDNKWKETVFKHLKNV